MSAASVKKSHFGVYISLFFGITTFLLLGLLTLLSINIVSTSVKQDHLKLNAEIAKANAQQIGEWVQGFQKEVQVYSNLNFKADDKAAQKFLLDLDTRYDSNFETIFYTGRDGKTFSHLKTSVDVKDREYFQAIMNDGKDFFIGNPIISRTTNNAVVNIACAVKDAGGQNTGFVCGNLSINTLNQRIADIKIGKEGYAYVVDGTSLIIAHPNTDFVMKLKISDGGTVGVKGVDKMWDVMSQGKSLTMDVDTPAGVQTMVSAPIPNTPNWSIVVAVPLSEIMETSYSLTAALISVSLFIFVIMLLISIAIGKSVVKPIKFAGRAIRQIAEGEADLTITIENKRTDEIGQLTNDFNRFVTKLREIVVSLKDSQTTLKDIGGHLTLNVQDTASAVHEIIANLESVGTQVNSQVNSVEETSSAVIEIARNIESLENLIQTQASAVSQASSSIEEMIGNIGSVNDSTTKMNQEFKILLEDMRKGMEKQNAVEGSIKLIADQSSMLIEANMAIASVASQTNLLAMNAAIEAAHAGDAGKGFSVVADEIRKLSENTSEQSRTIGSELKKVQDSINTVVVTAKESEETFVQLQERIEKTNTLVQEISLAMSEQNEGSKQVFEALKSMNDVTSQVRTGAKEMMTGNDSILEGVRLLKDTSATIKASLDEMNEGAKDINKSATNLSEMAHHTQSTIQQVEEAIGKFKV